MSKGVVTFGEIMLRLSAQGHLRFGQAQSFDVAYGGAEANMTGSKLITKELVAAGDFAAISEKIQQVIGWIRRVRGEEA
jgi:hypothetical protein